MMSISKAALLAELDLAQRLLTKWQGLLEQGIPQVDIPGSEESADAFARELFAEATLLAGKFTTIAEVISNDLTG